jgi:hypothetical protein
MLTMVMTIVTKKIIWLCYMYTRLWTDNDDEANFEVLMISERLCYNAPTVHAENCIILYFYCYKSVNIYKCQNNSTVLKN